MSAWRRRVGAALLVTVWLAAPPLASAHDLAQSESRLEVEGTTLRSRTIVDLLEFPGVDADGNGRISIAELDRSIAAVFAAVKTHLVVHADDAAPRRITLDRHELSDEHVLEMDIAYEFTVAPSRVEVTSTLDQLSKPQHQHLVSAVVAGDRQQVVLDAASRRVALDLSASRVTWTRVLAVVGAIALIAARFFWTRGRRPARRSA